MPRMDGLEATRIIQREFPRCKVALLPRFLKPRLGSKPLKRGDDRAVWRFRGGLRRKQTWGRLGAARVKYGCFMRLPLGHDSTRLFSHLELL
jgi:hypothetical protein